MSKEKAYHTISPEDDHRDVYHDHKKCRKSHQEKES